MFPDKGFFYMNVRLMMYKYSNLGAICAKGLCGDERIDKTLEEQSLAGFGLTGTWCSI